MFPRKELFDFSGYSQYSQYYNIWNVKKLVKLKIKWEGYQLPSSWVLEQKMHPVLAGNGEEMKKSHCRVRTCFFLHNFCM